MLPTSFVNLASTVNRVLYLTLLTHYTNYLIGGVSALADFPRRPAQFVLRVNTATDLIPFTTKHNCYTLNFMEYNTNKDYTKNKPCSHGSLQNDLPS